MIGIASNLWIVERAKSVTAISVYKHCKPRCAATLIMIDTSAFVVFLLGNIEEALCWLSQCCEYQEELNHLFFPSFAMLCRFVFFYISFVSGIFPRLTDRLCEEAHICPLPISVIFWTATMPRAWHLAPARLNMKRLLRICLFGAALVAISGGNDFIIGEIFPYHFVCF